MRNVLLFLFFLLITTASHAQVKITTIKGLPGSYSDDHSFPWIRSANKTVAEKINKYLQSELLSNETVQTSPQKIFENSVFIQNDSISQSGITFIDYETVVNNKNVLSLKFSVETMGAYPEGYERGYSFYTKTGEPVATKDLFTQDGINWLKAYLVRSRADSIAKYRSEQTYHDPEDSIYVRETFAECNSEADEDQLFIRPTSILFYKEYCFPHAARPYDEPLDIEISFTNLSRYFTPLARKLFLNK